MVNWADIRAELERDIGLAQLPSCDCTVEQLAEAYLRSVITRCAPRPRECNNSAKNVAAALEPLRQLYGALPAAGLGPRQLRAYQLHLVRQGLAFKTVSGRVGWIRSMVRWAVAIELLPPERLLALQAVSALRSDGAMLAPPVRAADPDEVQATLPYLRPRVADAVEWMRLTGARVGEAAALHASMLEHVDGLWLATPPNHKNSWRGHGTAIVMGPRASSIVLRHLCPGLAVFRPPRGGQYSSQTLSQAIRRGIEEALIARAIAHRWAPRQLRHMAASQCSSLASPTVAQRMLRHRHLRTTQGYIHCDPDLVQYLLRYG